MTKEIIDYDELKAGFEKIRAKEKSKQKGLKGVRRSANRLAPTTTMFPWPYPYPGDDIFSDIIKKALKYVMDKFFPKPADFGEDDLKNIEHLIQMGRLQGLEEMEIRVSKDLGSKIELSSKLPIENIPLGTSLTLQKNNKGDYVIHVRYESVKHLRDLDALRQYDELRKQGIISEEDFERKKKQILEN